MCITMTICLKNVNISYNPNSEQHHATVYLQGVKADDDKPFHLHPSRFLLRALSAERASPAIYMHPHLACLV